MTLNRQLIGSFLVQHINIMQKQEGIGTMLKILKCGLLGLVFLAMATPALAEIEVSGDAYATISSMYLWRGFDLSEGDPVAQGGIDIGFNGFTLGFWSNYNLDNTKLDETDITIDYGFNATEQVAISIGHILYAVDGTETTGEIYTAVAVDSLLEPVLTLYYDYDEFAGDIFITAEVGHSIPLGDELDLSLGALASYYRNDDYNALHNLEISLGLGYALTEQLSIETLGIFSAPLSSKAKDAIDDEFMAALSLNLSF